MGGAALIILVPIVFLALVLLALLVLHLWRSSTRSSILRRRGSRSAGPSSSGLRV